MKKLLSILFAAVLILACTQSADAAWRGRGYCHGGWRGYGYYRPVPVPAPYYRPYYAPVPPPQRWIPPHYRRGPYGDQFIPGHWSRY